MATHFQFIQLSLIKINDFKGVVIRVYHFNKETGDTLSTGKLVVF